MSQIPYTVMLKRAEAAREAVRFGVDPLLALSYVIDPTPNMIEAETQGLAWSGVRPLTPAQQRAERLERDRLYRHYRDRQAA